MEFDKHVSVCEDDIFLERTRQLVGESMQNGLFDPNSQYRFSVRGNEEGFCLAMLEVNGLEVTEINSDIFPRDYFKVNVIHVADSNRRKGIGARLYSFTESLAKEVGCGVGVVSPSRGSELFWKAMGFDSIMDDSYTLFRPPIWTKKL